MGYNVSYTPHWLVVKTRCSLLSYDHKTCKGTVRYGNVFVRYVNEENEHEISVLDPSFLSGGQKYIWQPLQRPFLQPIHTLSSIVAVKTDFWTIVRFIYYCITLMNSVESLWCEQCCSTVYSQQFRLKTALIIYLRRRPLFFYRGILRRIRIGVSAGWAWTNIALLISRADYSSIRVIH